MTDTMKLISPVDGSLYAERAIASDAEIASTFSLAGTRRKAGRRCRSRPASTTA